MAVHDTIFTALGAGMAVLKAGVPLSCTATDLRAKPGRDMLEVLHEGHRRDGVERDEFGRRGMKRETTRIYQLSTGLPGMSL